MLAFTLEKEKQMIKYPYPVLTLDGSSYKEGICYELTFVRNFATPGKMTFEFSVKLNSALLKSMLDNAEAKMFIRVQTGIFVGIQEISDYTNNVQCPLLLENIEANDIIRFTAYIVCNNNLLLQRSDEFLDIYPQDYAINLKKNDTLAISNEESLSYNSSNNDFIRFQVQEEQNGKGFYVGYETNYIVVHIGKDMNIAYGLIKNNNKDLCTIFDNHLVFEVFVNVLIDLAQDLDEYKDAEWFKLFEQIYLQVSNDKFEEFVAQVRSDDGYIDMKQIFEKAHQMCNNQIENSLISLSKKIGE